MSRLALAAFTIAALAAPSSAAELSPTEVLQRSGEKAGTGYVQWRDPRGSAMPGEDKTLSPYFFVAGGDPETERLPLKETSAQVQIAGVIAKVKVRQVFENSGTKAIEAVYVFPASTRAAVHGMRMKIGQRTVEAKIERKAEARAQYEQAKAEGKRASLLEQERPNVFTMSVANVMPKDRIEVELDYSELLVPEDATYEFVYPTVVGPRYGGGADPQKDKWIGNPYLQEGQKEPYRFDISVHVETGIPLKELVSPSHKVVVNYLSKASADVRLQESGGGTKDFVLRYRLAGDKIESGLLLWKGEKESFFLMMMEPPQRPTLAQIPPREYIFVVDVSGSMHGYPLDTAKELARNLLGQLRPTDLFNVALFSGANYVMSPEGSLPATAGNVEMGMDLIRRQRGGGGTELAGGLRAAYAVPKKVAGLSRTVVVITDGFVGVEAQTFKFVREHLNEANCFAFGIGNSVNRGLIEGLARAGQGEPFVVQGPDKAKAEAEKLKAYIQSPVLSQIEVSFPGFEAREVAPMKVPDLLASRPIVLFGKYRGEAKGKIQVTGFTGSGRFQSAVEVQPEAVKAENAPLRWLWARKWVAFLDDELHMTRAKEIEDAITDLGLSYTLLTTFTSFVAVDSEVANKSGRAETVNQPLPLPEGVSNLAVGGGAGGAATGIKGGHGAATRSPGASGQIASESVAAPSAAPAGPPPPAPKPMMAARPVAAEPMAKRERKASRLSLGDSDDESGGETALRLMVADLKASGLSETRPLVAAIDQQLKAASGCATAATTVKLKLTVDKAGKVVKVETADGDRKLGACLEARLKGLVSATVASEGTSGILEIAIRVMSL
ncbi:MAG: VWA domain-containing protein [Deltaproteobacteria bacterium]|nr:VWA domain-containing protein [Deltaproteobacteria bacterium]